MKAKIFVVYETNENGSPFRDPAGFARFVPTTIPDEDDLTAKTIVLGEDKKNEFGWYVVYPIEESDIRREIAELNAQKALWEKGLAE